MGQEDGTEDFDVILIRLKTGKWNMVIFLLCGFSAFRMPAHTLSGAFVAPALNFSCVPPTSSTSNISYITNVSMPLASADDECQYRDAADGELKECTEWQYDTSVFESTLTSEYDLVCQRSYLRSLYSSVYMFGALFGYGIGGYLADWQGRKLTLSIGIIGFAVLPTIMSWVPSFPFIMFCRFLIGTFHPLTFMTFYIIAMEACEPKHRATVGIATSLPWGLGTIAWGGLAYIIRDWQWLNFVGTIPSMLLLPCLWVIDESPRWLVVHGQHERALTILKKAAKMNSATLPDDEALRKIMESATSHASDSETNKLQKFRKELGLLFSNRQLRRRIFIMWLMFFVASMVFYGLSLSAITLSADPFIYMALGGLAEVPAYSVSVPIVMRWGRRLPISTAYIAGGVTILILAFVSNDMPWLVMTLAMLGKMAISMAFQAIWLFTTELLPTEVRQQGLGSTGCASRTGGMLAPFIADNLGQSVPWIPSVIFGCSSIVAGMATLLQPETKGCPMPDTVEELQKSTTDLHKMADRPAVGDT